MVPKLRSDRSVQSPKRRGSRSASLHGTSKTAPSRQPHKKKDIKLHSLIFEEGGLLDGIEMTYNDKGESLLNGYKAGSQIFCYHCSTKVSPSEFEKHAAMKAKRNPHKKPYTYIQLENRHSLHKVALYLWKIHSVVDSGNSSAGGEKSLLCDECRGFFQKDSASFPMNTPAEGQCGLCGREFTGENSNAFQAGSSAEVHSVVHPIINTDECATCDVKKNGEALVVCPLTGCRGYKSCDCQFGPLALIDCVQCEKQFHLRCLKEQGKSDLKAKLKGKWFCSLDCESSFLTLESLIGDGGEEKLKAFLVENGRMKNMDKNSLNLSRKGVRWRLLCSKSNNSDDKLLLDATSILYENFENFDWEELSASTSSKDLIRDMVYGKKGQNRRMYCAVVTEGPTVVAAGLFRVLGQDLAELPLVATAKANQGKGYFRLLIFYIEELLKQLNVRLFVLPAIEDAKKIWIEKFGFQKMSSEEKKSYEDNCWHIVDFVNADMLQKVITKDSVKDMEI